MQQPNHHQAPDSRARAARTRRARRALRWTCGTCQAINPDITGRCIRCGQG